MPSASARSPSTAALIELRGVGKRYTTGASPTDGVPALVDIDLRVREALTEWFPDLDLAHPVMQGVADPV